LSVANAQLVNIQPYARKQELFALPQFRGNVGRFNSWQTLSGDASGGTYTTIFNLSQAAGALGNKLLFKLTNASVYFVGAIAAPIVDLWINAGEVTWGGQQAGLRSFISIGSNLYSAAPNTLFDAIFKMSSQYQTAIQFSCTPNTNAVQMVTYINGLVYDEEYMP